jgi:ABC-type polysaccharide/polyol phosphate transport system ATPase subunit
MNDIVIRAEGLGKKYLIGHHSERERYTALRDVVARSARGLIRSAADIARGRAMISGDEIEEFWALRGVDIEIARGEVVGIVGGNGAGKSTLLKILSRITEPSEGRVIISGRVASLLEVGTGFHPELSGRENIFLNGAILGMTHAEIRRKFDEIIDFAGVEKFLDTPVKRYSSGMYVRLAFAVAAHLEPEILVVDEVLAVGDAEFQKKCLGKMGDLSNGGRTVLFVSHNLEAVRTLCSRALLLQGGRKIYDDHTDLVIDAHLHQDKKTARLESYREQKYKNTFELESITWTRSVLNESGKESIVIELNVTTRDDLERELALIIEDCNQKPIFTTHLSDHSSFLRARKAQSYRIELPAGLLRTGSYHITFSSFIPKESKFYDVVLHYPMPEIINAETIRFDKRTGAIFIPLRWRADEG